MKLHVHIYFDSDHYRKSEYRNVRGISTYSDRTILYLNDDDKGMPQSPVHITAPIYNLSAFEQDDRD